MRLNPYTLKEEKLLSLQWDTYRYIIFCWFEEYFQKQNLVPKRFKKKRNFSSSQHLPIITPKYLKVWTNLPCYSIMWYDLSFSTTYQRRKDLKENSIVFKLFCSQSSPSMVRYKELMYAPTWWYWGRNHLGGQSRAGCVDVSGTFRMTHNGVGFVLVSL